MQRAAGARSTSALASALGPIVISSEMIQRWGDRKCTAGHTSMWSLLQLMHMLCSRSCLRLVAQSLKGPPT